ncbi:MAG: hypothetical protein NW237_14160 [Cyanobacteriota bacterium]|nr:hypothetical protein [Cyanobacteriota bacterium]
MSTAASPLPMERDPTPTLEKLVSHHPRDPLPQHLLSQALCLLGAHFWLKY